MASGVRETVWSFMEHAAARRGLELVDVTFRREGGAWYLRVFLDRPGGLRLEDCEAVSGELSRFLDATDPIPQRYYLEVSSPGEERPLRRESDFVRFAGRPVRLRVGHRKLRGVLEGVAAGRVRVRREDGELEEIALGEVSEAHLRRTQEGAGKKR